MFNRAWDRMFRRELSQVTAGAFLSEYRPRSKSFSAVYGELSPARHVHEHWGHEPFVQKLLIHNETIFRFMEKLGPPNFGRELGP